jgi:hypothetical protein
MTELEQQIRLLNDVANQPEVLAWVAPGHERIDLRAFFDRPGNLMLGNPLGVVLFGNLGDALYSCHFLFTAKMRGPDALRAIKMAFSSLFTYKDCVAITGLIPRENRASRAMVRALGCRPIGETTDMYGRPCISYMLERKKWVISSGA